MGTHSWTRPKNIFNCLQLAFTFFFYSLLATMITNVKMKVLSVTSWTMVTIKLFFSLAILLQVGAVMADVAPSKSSRKSGHGKGKGGQSSIAATAATATSRWMFGAKYVDGVTDLKDVANAATTLIQSCSQYERAGMGLAYLGSSSDYDITLFVDR
jgi:hypothetical protein